MNLKSFLFCLFFFVLEYSVDILQEHAYIRSLSSREGWREGEDVYAKKE